MTASDRASARRFLACADIPNSQARRLFRDLTAAHVGDGAAMLELRRKLPSSAHRAAAGRVVVAVRSRGSSSARRSRRDAGELGFAPFCASPASCRGGRYTARPQLSCGNDSLSDTARTPCAPDPRRRRRQPHDTPRDRPGQPRRPSALALREQGAVIVDAIVRRQAKPRPGGALLPGLFVDALIVY